MGKYALEAERFIKGSTSGAELGKLEELARKHIKRGGNACEIGSEYGRSTYVIASVCKEKNACLFVLDKKIRCKRVLKGLPVIFKEGNSRETFREVPGGLDFVFIDGDHTLPTVIYDFINFWDKLDVGGLLAAHDYRNMDKSNSEVKLVVDNLWKFRDGSHLKDTSLWWKEK